MGRQPKRSVIWRPWGCNSEMQHYSSYEDNACQKLAAIFDINLVNVVSVRKIQHANSGNSLSDEASALRLAV